MYSKAKGQYLRMSLPLHALFLQRSLPESLPSKIPECVLQGSIALTKLCIQHTTLIARRNTDGQKMENSVQPVQVKQPTNQRG